MIVEPWMELLKLTLTAHSIYLTFNLPNFLFCHFVRIEMLDTCFSHDTVEEIINALVSIF